MYYGTHDTEVGSGQERMDDSNSQTIDFSGFTISLVSAEELNKEGETELTQLRNK